MTGTRADPSSTVPPRFELLMRVASGVVMVLAIIAAVIGGGLLFAAIVAIVAVAALREWHRLVNGHVLARETIPTGAAAVAVVLLVHAHQPILWPLAAIGVGAVLAALSAALRGVPVLWHAFGAAYVGLPVLAIMVLREDPAWGGLIVGAIFAAVWAADTGALLLGRAIGGPRLAPVLSPNKTWAGLVGGMIAAVLVEIVYVGAWGGTIWIGALLGVALGTAAHSGDLFESWVKRQFQAKNTGTLIPGHGGVLDRIDSLLFAAPAGAVLLYLSELNPFGGPGP